MDLGTKIVDVVVLEGCIVLVIVDRGWGTVLPPEGIIWGELVTDNETVVTATGARDADCRPVTDRVVWLAKFRVDGV